MIQEKKSVTPFGTVTPDHVIYNVRRGWFKGGSPEDIPLRRVSRVELETRRHPILAVLLVLAALACRAMGPMGIAVAIVPLTVAILLLWGSPLVRVHTADGKFLLISGLPWTRAEAEWFVAAVDHRRIVDASRIGSTDDRHRSLLDAAAISSMRRGDLTSAFPSDAADRRW
jgi:hypothetical protein